MPFCNYDESNLDWILETLKTILNRTENGFQEMLDEYMQKYFNTLFADITYLPDSETIVLQLSTSIQSDTDKHAYKNGALVIF